MALSQRIGSFMNNSSNEEYLMAGHQQMLLDSFVSLKLHFVVVTQQRQSAAGGREEGNISLNLCKVQGVLVWFGWKK